MQSSTFRPGFSGVIPALKVSVCFLSSSQDLFKDGDVYERESPSSCRQNKPGRPVLKPPAESTTDAVHVTKQPQLLLLAALQIHPWLYTHTQWSHTIINESRHAHVPQSSLDSCAYTHAWKGEQTGLKPQTYSRTLNTSMLRIAAHAHQCVPDASTWQGSRSVGMRREDSLASNVNLLSLWAELLADWHGPERLSAGQGKENQRDILSECEREMCLKPSQKRSG